MAQLIDFVENEFTFDTLENASVPDDDDIESILRPKSKENLLRKLKACCQSKGSLNTPQVNLTLREVDRALKMFFLHMQMSSHLK